MKFREPKAPGDRVEKPPTMLSAKLARNQEKAA
jgi:hypothetical protein